MRQARSLQTSTYRVARSGFFDFSCTDVRTCNMNVLSVPTIEILHKRTNRILIGPLNIFPVVQNTALYSVMLWSALTIDDFIHSTKVTSASA